MILEFIMAMITPDRSQKLGLEVSANYLKIPLWWIEVLVIISFCKIFVNLSKKARA